MADPSNYWISVINTGRHFMLDKVMGENDLQDAHGVGHVIGRLMKVADTAGIEPASVAMAPGDVSALETEMIADIFAAKLPGVAAPTCTTAAASSLRLLPEAEVAA